jgi:hypothetical protein
VAVYVVGGRRGIIYFPESYEGRGWRKVVLELGKVNDFLKFLDGHGMSRLASTPEKLRAGDVNNEDYACDVWPGNEDVLIYICINAPFMTQRVLKP